MTSPSGPTYAQAAQQSQFPKKEQAIIIEAIEGLKVKEYAKALCTIIEPKDIQFISRISNNRICAYLANKEIVKELTENNKQIQIQGMTLPIRPLMVQNKRVIISNVCPVIPHQIIEENLKKLNITLTSSISFIRAGLAEVGLPHVLSFRRQTYINPEDSNKLPSSIQINYENTNYWIYISTDSLSCFVCKEKGHLAKHCPTIVKTNTTQPPITPHLPNTHIQSQTKDTQEPNKTTTLEIHMDIEQYTEGNINTIPTTTKRPLSISTENTKTGTTSTDAHAELEESDDSDNKHPWKTPKPPIKKTKKILIIPDSNATTSDSDTDGGDDSFRDVSEFITNGTSKNFPLDVGQLKSLIENAKRTKDLINTAKDYTEDIPALINMFREINPFLSTKGLKNRCTRIVTQLNKYLNGSK